MVPGDESGLFVTLYSVYKKILDVLLHAMFPKQSSFNELAGELASHPDPDHETCCGEESSSQVHRICSSEESSSRERFCWQEWIEEWDMCRQESKSTEVNDWDELLALFPSKERSQRIMEKAKQKDSSIVDLPPPVKFTRTFRKNTSI